MSPVTHFLVAWVVANAGGLDRRDRAIVTAAGVVPDVDGLGVIAEVLTRGSSHPLWWFADYHRLLGHNLGFGLLTAAVGALLAARRWRTAALAFVSFHLHLLGDLAGSQGPDGSQWPFPYLFPFSNAWQLTWRGQWELDAWPNYLITAVVLAVTFFLAWQRGYSPLEMFSGAADRAFEQALRRRLPPPAA